MSQMSDDQKAQLLSLVQQIVDADQSPGAPDPAALEAARQEGRDEIKAKIKNAIDSL